MIPNVDEVARFLMHLGAIAKRMAPAWKGAHVHHTACGPNGEIIGRILPGADVVAFIDKMLADWHTPAERNRFLTGLPDLDVRSRARASRAFVDCGEADQVAVLTALDGEVTALRASDGDTAANQHWFAMLKYLTVYGWCTSEAGARELGLYPLAGRYDGCAPV